MAQHTPTPWTYEDLTIWGPKREEIAILGTDAGPLHRVAGEKRDFKPHPKSAAIANANGLVLAASAELLKALKDLREACTDVYKTGRIAAEPFVTAGLVIAKAEGR